MRRPLLLALTYETVEAAAAALEVLERLEDERALRLDDAALVAGSPAGSVEIRQRRQLAVGEGVVAGGALGLLVGLVAGGPVLGAVAGMAGGAGWSARDTGLSDEQLARFAPHLARGGAAVFALVREPRWRRVREALAPYGGELAASEVAPALVEEWERARR